MGAGSGPSISIIKILNKQKEIDLRLIACDMDNLASGLYLCDNYFLTPSCSDPTFVDFIESMCKKLKINFIFCPLDVESLVLSKHKKRFQNLGIEMSCDHWEKIILATDKSLAHCICKLFKIKTPKTYINKFPSKILKKHIYKPAIGVGGKNNFVIKKYIDLKKIKTENDTQFLCQEYIEGGTEYSIDIFCDNSGQPVYCIPRERISVKSGQMVKGRTVKDKQLEEYAKYVAKSFKIAGESCLQCIRKNSEIFFIEYNPRYGTGVNLSNAAGVSLPILDLKMRVNNHINKSLTFKEITMSRYWNEVFI